MRWGRNLIVSKSSEQMINEYREKAPWLLEEQALGKMGDRKERLRGSQAFLCP